MALFRARGYAVQMADRFRRDLLRRNTRRTDMILTAMYNADGAIVGVSYGPSAAALEADGDGEQGQLQHRTIDIDSPSLSTDLNSKQRFELLDEIMSAHAVDVTADPHRIVNTPKR